MFYTSGHRSKGISPVLSRGASYAATPHLTAVAFREHTLQTIEFSERDNPVAALKKGVIVLTGHVIGEIKDALKLHGRRLVDALYNASVFSTISVGAALLILFIVGWAITNNIIHVPVFHPDIPVTSGN